MMKSQDLTKAKDPTLRGSEQALKRAATLARRTAIQTGTALVIMEAGRLVHISAEDLRKQDPVDPSPQASHQS